MDVLLATLRPTGVLGDQNVTTTESATKPAGLIDLGTLNARDATATLAAAGTGAISFVYFLAKVGITGTDVRSGNDRLRWIHPSGNADATSGAFPLGLSAYQSAPVTTKPGGGAWTWADLAALTSPGALSDWADPEFGDVMTLTIAEAWIEVYGPVSLSSSVMRTARVGPVKLISEVGAVLLDRISGGAIQRVSLVGDGPEVDDVATVTVKIGQSIQAAINSIAGTGGSVRIPAGVWVLPAGSTLTIPKNVHVFGDGINATWIRSNDTTNAKNAFVWINGPFAGLADLTITGPEVNAACNGILMQPLDLTSNVTICELRNIQVIDACNYSLYIADGSGANGTINVENRFVSLQLDNSYNGAAGNLYVGQSNTAQHFENCQFLTQTGYAVNLNFCVGMRFSRCTFERSTDAFDIIHLSRTQSCSFEDCWHESHWGANDPLNIPFYDLTEKNTGFLMRGGYFSFDLTHKPMILQTGTGPTIGAQIIAPTCLVKSQPAGADIDHTGRSDINLRDAGDDVTLQGGLVIDDTTLHSDIIRPTAGMAGTLKRITGS